MIKTHQMVMEELKGYASPRAKLTRIIASGALVPLRRGLFVDDATMSPRVLAPVLYGPSYISFQFALAAYGLIPERVSVVTSATFNKNKDKTYRTPLGEFSYFYLPGAIYPYGVRIEELDGMSYLIAAPEKALCDAVYKAPKVTGLSAMADLLLEDWRMAKEDLAELDADFIRWIAPLYRRKSLMALASWFQREAA